MNREQVIDWARDAGTWEYAATREERIAQYMRFAALVADAEREACTEIMEQQHTWITNAAASALIRARNTNKETK